MPHQKIVKEDAEGQVPRIAFDYFFASWEDEQADKKPHDHHGG